MLDFFDLEECGLTGFMLGKSWLQIILAELKTRDLLPSNSKQTVLGEKNNTLRQR